MARTVAMVDPQAFARAWVNGTATLVGAGRPLTDGVHIGAVRVPPRGTIAGVQPVNPQSIDSETGWQTSRVSFAIHSVGGERGARLEAWRAGAALRALFDARIGDPVVVEVEETPGGPLRRVRLMACMDVEGPTQTAQLGRETVYAVDVTFDLLAL